MYAEIHLNEPIGQTISNIVATKRLLRNLEIGSWGGAGSSTCFVQAMLSLHGDKHIDCIEIVFDKFNELKDRFKDIPFVHCHNKSSVSYDDLVYKDFESIWTSPFNKIPNNLYSKELVQSWFDRDLDTIKSAKVFDLAAVSPYDSVLIDGSEFTGYSEFQLIKDKTRVLFLDDVHNAFKCYQIYDELIKSKDWICLVDAPNWRNGFAAFEKVI